MHRRKFGLVGLAPGRAVAPGRAGATGVVVAPGTGMALGKFDMERYLVTSKQCLRILKWLLGSLEG